MSNPRFDSITLRAFLVFSLFFNAHSSLADSPQKPNFLVIVADDLGWSDIGKFGSEIRTPAIDALAERGVTMTRFYVAPTCSPTRAMLMTGVDSHIAGLGTMEGVQAKNQMGSEGYAGQLNDRVVTVAEALGAEGYATLMSGKWHLAVDEKQYPNHRGFDQSFALLEGGASHFADATPLYREAEVSYIENGSKVKAWDGFYSSTAYTDKLLGYLDKVGDGKPFFAYLAYTAPHDPLQVPDAWLEKYRGVYDQGPDFLREARAEQLSRLGLIAEGAPLWAAPTFPAFIPAHLTPWNEMTEEQKRSASRPIEIYAAMVEFMDAQIQRVIDYLEVNGQLENTYVIFLSDNGANGATPLSYPGNTRDYYRSRFSQSPGDQGKVGSHTYLGRRWASSSASPFKLYKGAIAEGGIRSPLIVAGPKVKADAYSFQVSHITDLTASLYALAGVHPQSAAIFSGKSLPEGRPLIHNWEQPKATESRTFATELFGHRAVVSDSWKATNMNPPLGNGQWELYNLDNDPSETNNIAADNPGKLQELIQFYDTYKARVGVIPPNPPVAISLGDLFTGECSSFCSVVVKVVDSLMGLWVNHSASEG